MMTVTPPRSDTSPDLSPYATPSGMHSTSTTPERMVQQQQQPQQPQQSQLQKHQMQSSIMGGTLDKAPVGFEVTHANALNVASSDYSLLNGRPLISFQKGPSPPQEAVLFGNHDLRRSTPNSLSYRNALIKIDSLGDIPEGNQATTGNFGDFAFDAASWSNALGTSLTSPTNSTSVNSNSTLSSQNNANTGPRKSVIGHRNTMPSMSTSPFQQHQPQQQQQQAIAQVTPSTSNNNLPYCGTSLCCYLVQFTSGRTDTFYIPQENHQFSVNVGDYVVVEADRGEDLGRVIMDNINVPLPRRNSTSVIQEEPPQMPMSFTGDEASQGAGGGAQNLMPKQIYRVAQPIEVESLLGKVRDELNAIAVGQYKVQEWKLPMAIIDAEYQWDRRKLTFFFSVTLPQYFPNQPSPRIDFRTLVRDLYQIYRTRIWMYCVDKDKNRSNRQHNREKFLKQLNKDTNTSSSSSSNNNNTSINTNASTNSTASNTNTSAKNSLKAVLEDAETWDILDKLNQIEDDDDSSVVDELAFGVNVMSVNR